MKRPRERSDFWRRAWINAVDTFSTGFSQAFRISQDRGEGMIIHGSREWGDCRIETALTVHLAQHAGVGIRVQGLRRFYAAFLVRLNLLRLIRARDGETTVLAETAFEWSFEKAYLFTIETLGQDISVAVDGVRLAARDDSELAITDGGFALIVQGGSASKNEIWVAPPTPRLARRTTHMTEPHVIGCELSGRAKRESGMAFVSEPDATLGVMEQLDTRHGGNRL